MIQLSLLILEIYRNFYVTHIYVMFLNSLLLSEIGPSDLETRAKTFLLFGSVTFGSTLYPLSEYASISISILLTCRDINL